MEPRPARYVEAFYFGTKPERARDIANLVLDGIKTATGSLKWSYDFDGKPLPHVGDLSIVTDGYNHPFCIIETTEVRILPLDEVDAQFAYEGGEEDRTLESWQRMYWSYIVHECIRIGREPIWKAPLVCERFRVIYQEPLIE
ncbi:MAG: ASCH domain-containing protein [Candidatus Tectomicrobia bacterium]|nr:ASCH domain-containing protein [Candidatus Tectomicrobia bacterium]